VIYRLTVQTSPDGLETQFTPLVVSGGRCELGISDGQRRVQWDSRRRAGAIVQTDRHLLVIAAGASGNREIIHRLLPDRRPVSSRLRTVINF